MCGRFVTPAERDLERYWEIKRPGSPFEGVPGRFELVNYNVYPTASIPAIRVAADGGLESLPLRWGLVPGFARGEPGKYHTHNARIENFRGAPAYRGAWKHGQRCLVPALGFYEWKDVGGPRKQPYFIHAGDQEIFAFAGLWDRSARDDGAVVQSCTIITMPASRAMLPIHSRMPAMLLRVHQQAWLRGTPDQALACLLPYPDELTIAYPVATRVNVPTSNDAGLIEKLAGANDAAPMQPMRDG